MEYIRKVLRIVTGTQKVLLKCNSGSDGDDDGIGDDSDSEGSLLKQAGEFWQMACVPWEPSMSRRSGSSKNWKEC